MGSPLLSKRNVKQWKLLDVVVGIMFFGVFVFFVLLLTPLGDSLAASGLKALDASVTDTIGREKIMKMVEKGQTMRFCPQTMTDHMPCQDPRRSSQFSRERNYYRERHCPPLREKLPCLIPIPDGYRIPIPWPESLHKVWYNNMPYQKIAERKGHQGWMKKDGEYFIFPGGGTMFPGGASQYIDKLEKYMPLNTGEIRTALDAGCGVASFGAHLLTKQVITFSFAPRDSHKAQIQFALERGIPAFVAMLGTQRLPLPARSFDLAHCSRCLIPFAAYNGSYLIEIDRLLRPGGYFVLSGPPVGWKKLEAKWDELRDITKRMCYSLVAVESSIAIWQKPLNHSCYEDAVERSPQLCSEDDDPNSAWYAPLRDCVSRLPEMRIQDDRSGGKLPNWPKRLEVTPRRFLDTNDPDGFHFEADTLRWKRRVKHYKDVLLIKIGSPRSRNILDMNAVYGGFAAAVSSDPVWVMNTVPVSEQNTLPIIYDRGLLGVVHDWCEAFSTYPRTYDLIHVVKIHILPSNLRCSLVDVMVEMDRILRPQGTVIIRDTTKVVEQVLTIANALGWIAEISTTEMGATSIDRLLVATKPFALAGSTQS